MNFDGIFEALNYTHNPAEYYEDLEAFVKSQVTNLHTTQENKAWVIERLENEFMHNVIRGMREFLKSPFTS